MKRHDLPRCFGMASLLRCSSGTGNQEAPQASCSCESVHSQRAHSGKTSPSLAPAPLAQAPACAADAQKEAEKHWPDPAVGNHSPVSWAEGAGTQESQA